MWSDVMYRLRALFQRDTVERELDGELRFHLEHEVEKNIQAGMTPDQATRQAHVAFGGFDQVKEKSRDSRGISALEIAARDLRYGVRVLRKSPGFTVVAVLSLALGIGANAAIFQLVNAVRLRTLPVKDPQELAEVRLADMSGARGSFNRFPAVTNPIWEEIRNRQQIFSGVFAWSSDSINLAPSGEIRPAQALWVSGNFFDVLGVKPLLGRVFTAASDRRGCGLPGVVISYPFWQREFGGEASVIGRVLSLAAHPVEIIGIAPASFFGLEVGRTFDVALPLCSEAAIRGKNRRLDSGTTWWLTVMGRLRPGVSLEFATAQLGSISRAVFEASLPAGYPPVSVKKYLESKLISLPAANGISQVRERHSNPLSILQAIAVMVLLIACANLANLMLARASVREREIAVRLAIGASRGRLAGQLMVESFLIATAGAAVGFFLARKLSQLLVSMLSTKGSTIFMDLAPDWRVFAFIAGLAILASVLFGLTPAVMATQRAPGDLLKSGSRGATAGRERFGLRRILVISQVAVSLVLLVAALLFVRSLRNLMTLEAGFHQDGVLIANVNFLQLNLPVQRISMFQRDLVERVRAIPGVIAAADTSVVPLSGNASGNRMWIDGAKPEGGADVLRSRVGPGYFKTLRTPLLAGRDFGPRDAAGCPKVAVVNEAFSRSLLSGANPIGKRFWIEATPDDPETLYEIVGLVRNAKYVDLREEFSPVVFQALSQDPRPSPGDQILIRSDRSLDLLIPAVRRTVSEFRPGIRFSFQVFKTQVRDSLVRERPMATLSGWFGFLAASLAAIGLYGVISYMVARRKNEIGIRMAIGASRADIVVMIIGQSALLLAIGLTAGTLLSLALGRTARALLFGLEPYDPMTIIVAVALLAAVALAASYLPARRAAGLDPTAALRQE